MFVEPTNDRDKVHDDLILKCTDFDFDTCFTIRVNIMFFWSTIVMTCLILLLWSDMEFSVVLGNMRAGSELKVVVGRFLWVRNV